MDLCNDMNMNKEYKKKKKKKKKHVFAYSADTITVVCKMKEVQWRKCGKAELGISRD